MGKNQKNPVDSKNPYCYSNHVKLKSYHLMSNFITNSQTKLLRKRLTDLLSKGVELKFLVGFFYFSGLKELYEGLKNNPNINFKVLVGLNVDRTIYGLFEHSEDKKNASDEEKTYHLG